MSVHIKGMEKLLVDLEKRFGEEKVRKISDQALKDGAKVFVNELKNQFESFKDTGASIDEIKISRPVYVKGVRTIKIHWRGPKERYRIIHLNEWGTVQNPNPKGKGTIARALRNAENAFHTAVKEAVRRSI
ncbi:HK97 gp10 family phage protein [Priestia megaterium]|uniref:HK97 gp10 family phage protein n=1 Tax=Priestia megaterium TaxID=1404 RepID=UPI0005C65F27|nr:HK97 gp10 family phage protein [Priestia megaterium]